MAATKEADLINAVLRYAIRCLADGDRESLRAMNFGPKEIEALRGMQLADLPRLESLGAHCLEINLNRDVYWTMVAHLQRERAAEALQHDLIKADAPFEMMQRLFGLGSRDYTRLRRLFGVPPTVGRPPEPDQALAHRVWAVARERFEQTSRDELLGEDYLEIAEKSVAPLRAVWQLTERWVRDGELCAPGRHEGSAERERAGADIVPMSSTGA